MTHIDIINAFVEKRAYQAYLEISNGAGGTFQAVQCASKHRVVPEPGASSDEFFATNTAKFDIVFIDGVHQCDQVLREIQNSIAALRSGGVVVIHDCLPPTDEAARGRPVSGRAWCGDVFRAIAWYFSKSRYLCYTVDTDFGVGVIDLSREAVACASFPCDTISELSYGAFWEDRGRLAHIMPAGSFYGLVAPGDLVDSFSNLPLSWRPKNIPAPYDLVPRRQPSAGNTCVVYATDGGRDDVARLSMSARSLVKRSRLAFDLVVLSDAAIPESAVLGREGVVPYYNCLDMCGVLQGVGMQRDQWTGRRWPFAALYRLGVPLHSGLMKYRRMVYLDTDTLVLSGDVDHLMEADLGGAEVGCVYDIDGDCYSRIADLLYNDTKSEYVDSIVSDIGPSIRTRAYVNSGVLLMDLDVVRARRDWYVRRLGMYWEASCRGKFAYIDQDFINAMMRVRADFNTMFNWQRGGYPGGCVIRHYIAGQKQEMAARAREEGLV